MARRNTGYATVSRGLSSRPKAWLVGLGWGDKIARTGVSDAIEADPSCAVDAGSLLRAVLTILGPKTTREARP